MKQLNTFNYFILWIFFIGILHAENLGHRLGGDVFAPGDTLYSYEKLIDKFNKSSRIKNIEFDVQETKDNHLVVFHDIGKIYRIVPKTQHNSMILKDLLSHKDFKSIKIHDLTLNQIKNLRLEHNATIPTLLNVLKKSVQLNIDYPIRIEIKRLYTDRAREKLIAILKQYKQKLKMELIAFRKNYEISFPLQTRWLNKLNQLGINFYQIDRHLFIAKNKYIKYQTLLDEKFSINRQTGREIVLPLDILKTDVKDTILIGVFNGSDDSGNKGLNIKFSTDDNKYLFAAFSDNAYWQWYEVQLHDVNTTKYKIILEDFDTSFLGKHPGNGGRIKVLVAKI